MKQRQTPYAKFTSSFGKLTKAISNNEPIPFIVLHGLNDYLVYDSFKNLLSLNKHHNIDCSILDAREVTEVDFASLWEQQTLFAPKTFYGFQSCEKAPRILEFLTKFLLQHGTPHTFCFSFGNKTIPTKVKNSLDKHNGFTIPCSEPYQSELLDYIKQQSIKSQLPLDMDACRLIAESQGNDFFKINNEIQKLKLALASSEHRSSIIKRNDIAHLIHSQRLDSLFEIENLLLQRRYSLGLQHVLKLLKSGEPLLTIISVIANHCRKTLKIKSLPISSTPQDIANNTNIPIWMVGKYQAYARQTPQQTLRQVLELCHVADVNFKSTRISPDILASDAIMGFVD